MSFDGGLSVVGLIRLDGKYGPDSVLGRAVAVVTWEGGFALMAGEMFLNRQLGYGDHDGNWCFASNVGSGPDNWNTVRKFESVAGALEYLIAAEMVKS